jgi:HK97 gp10 family phage protein
MAAKFSNLRSLNVKLGRIGPQTRAEVRRALHRGALAIENRAVEGIIEGPKTGRIYASKHRKGAKHQASAPGEFPAADSGRLHQSITSVEASTGDNIRFETGGNVDYATYLELGTSKMAPRPHMVPAYEENVDKVRADVRAAVRRGART